CSLTFVTTFLYLPPYHGHLQTLHHYCQLPCSNTSFISSNASIVIASAQIENSKAEIGNPCLTPRPITLGSESIPCLPCLMYRSCNNLLSLQSMCKLFIISNIYMLVNGELKT